MKCFLYCRKSSEDQSRQVQSIGDQKKILFELAQIRGMEVAEIFSDEKSAGTPYQRKRFQEMIKQIHTGKVTSILTWKIDRLSRNPIENGQISWLLQQGIIKEIVTPDRTYLPQDNVLLYMVEGAMANQYIRDLSTNVKRGMNSKVERGIYPAYAPLGYLNDGKQKGNKDIIPDPKYFPKLNALWNLLKTENYQLADLYRIMLEKYPLDKMGTPVAFSSFHRIFHNPFYCGVFRWGGKTHLGTHKTMITQTEFERIQSHLSKKDKTRQLEFLFDYKGVFKCGTCGALITAERKKKLIKSNGKEKAYDYYKCAHHRRHVSCHEKPLSKLNIESQLFNEIEKLHLPDQVINHGILALKENDSYDSDTIKSRLNNLTREIQIKTKQKNIIENNLVIESDAEIRSIMKEKYSEMKLKIKQLEEDKLTIHKKAKIRNRKISIQLQIIEKAKTILLSDEIEQKKELLNTIGSNWRIKDKKLLYEPNFISKAIQKVKKSHSLENGRFEPTDWDSISAQKLSDDDASLLWRSVWELIKNSIF